MLNFEIQVRKLIRIFPLLIAKMLSRAGRTLHEVQSHLDREGASDLVVELVIKSVHSPSIFVEVVELGIALLEGGNPIIQKSIFTKLMAGELSQSFFKVKFQLSYIFYHEISNNLYHKIYFYLKTEFKHFFSFLLPQVFYEKMRDSQQEIKSTVTVNTSDLAAKAHVDKEQSKELEKIEGKPGVKFLFNYSILIISLEYHFILYLTYLYFVHRYTSSFLFRNYFDFLLRFNITNTRYLYLEFFLIRKAEWNRYN